MILDIPTLLQTIHLQLLIKITALIFIGMYTIFAIMLATKIRSFNKILFLPANGGGSLMQFITIAYSISVAILFLLTLIVL